MKTVFGIWAIFWLIIIQSGCTRTINNEVNPPEDLIPREEMVDIIVDMHIYDAIINGSKKQGFRNTKQDNYYLHNSIMEKYKLTHKKFEESFIYYQNDLEVIDDIYADAITRLSKMDFGKRDD